MSIRFFTFLYCFMLLGNLLYSQSKDKLAYQIFNSKGKKTTYAKIVQQAQKKDMVFFGETHNNPIAHWLTYELFTDLYQVKKEKLVIGLEMLEADNQIIIDEYLQGWIGNNNFEEETRLWPNYTTDYKPLVELAKANQLQLIATNIPRRYASLTFKQGLESLQKLGSTAKNWIAPLPIEVDIAFYQGLFNMAKTGHGSNNNLLNAQAIKDATMAHFILKNWEKGELFFHVNGLFHSLQGKGIVTYIKKNAPDSKILTIATVEQTEVHTLMKDNLGIADFIICIPKNMTKTY